MELPQIPTDNLYKFFSISGLVILFLCLLYPRYKQTEVEIQIAHLAAKERVLEIKIGEATKQTIKPFNPSTTVEKAQNEYITQQIEYDELKQTTLANNRYLDFLILLRWIGTPIGVLLVLIGFPLWYFKLQKWQDTNIATKQIDPSSS